MRKKIIGAAALVPFVATMLGAGPVGASLVGNEGCTPGYWKNHPESWLETTDPYVPIPTTRKLDGPFDTVNVDGDLTFMDALNFGGGPGLAGAEQILLRAAVAAWLNAATEEVGYPLRRDVIVARVNEAIASGDRGAMLALATELDGLNNLGCPL